MHAADTPNANVEYDPASATVPACNKILVVDDSPNNLRVLAAALSEHGCDARCAKSGAIALKAIEAELPDLILLDVRMPEMDGYEVCQHLKATPRTRDIPVIFISALDAAFDKVKAFNAGGADYITKPFQVEEVIARVRHQLELASANFQLNQLNQKLEQRVLQRTLELQTVNQQLQASEARLEQILNALADVVWSATLDPFQLLYLNPAAEIVFQQPKQNFIADCNLWFEVIHPDDRADVLATMQAMSARGSLDLEYRIIRPNGETRWVRSRAHVSATKDGASSQVEGITSDITDRKHIELELIYNALHDGLTDLPNRTLFIERIEHALKRKQRRPDYTFAVLFIDLDRFKSVNDRFGHAAGDSLLIEVAKRLRGCLRQVDTVARLGGDEFTILIDEITDVSYVETCVERILSELNAPIDIEGNIVQTGGSIGIVIATEKYETASALLRDSDAAMYRAKADPNSNYEYFNRLVPTSLEQ